LYKQVEKFERSTMMKKLLVLALVLGMAVVANAGLKIGGYDGRTLMPSDEVVLQIVTEEAIAGDLEYAALVCLVQDGSIAGGFATVPVANAGFAIYDNAVSDFGVWGMPDGADGVLAGITVFPGELAVPAGTIFDGIVFHCNGPVNVVVQLWQIRGTDFGAASLLDEITIMQAPEPMTMVLLGLGGLFLRKKK
jgi:hypothetical protein